MGLVSLLFSFKGRVNRTQYWLGTIGVNIAHWIAMVVLSSAAAVTAVQMKSPAAALAALGSQLALVLPVSMAAAWIAMALQVKRFHDRGQSGWWTMLPMAPVLFVVMNVGTAIAEQWSPERLVGSMGLPLMAFLLIGFGMFVNLGCLAGTQGENKYGGPPGSGGGYTPSTPAAPSSAPNTSAAAAASSLFGASAAIDRAIAEKGRAAAPQPQPQMQAPRPRPAPVAATLQPAPAGGAPSFGRRAR